VRNWREEKGEEMVLTICGQVTLKPEASHEELQNAKKEVESKGGKITHEFSLIKGFTYVDKPSPPPLCPSHALLRWPNADAYDSAELPDDLVSTFESNDKITVEKDAEVKTQ
jgi:hypothetical protein